MEQIARFFPPVLGIIFVFLAKVDLVSNASNLQNAEGWKAIGLLFPALWLAGVGPRRLVEKGGFVMQLLGIKATRQRVALVGLAWFLVFLTCDCLLSEEILTASFGGRLAYALGYAGLMSSLGVFAFLAVSPDERSAT